MPKLAAVPAAVLALMVPVAAPAKGQAQPVRIEIVSRAPAFDGKAFGDRGAYERIVAVARMRIDPRRPENRDIVDLAGAPRAADGMVEYDVDLAILRPADPARARRVMLYEVVNRGMKLIGSFAGSGGYGDPTLVPGDGLLQRQGWTMVWSGWQGDIDRPGMMGARFPVATGAKDAPLTGPLTGRVSTETIFDSPKGDRLTLGWPVATLDQSRAELTVRQRSGDVPRVIPADRWRFVDDRTIALERPADMDAGAIYRFAYTARDPKVMGLGFAATRDLVAFLRHATAAQGNPLADLASAPCEHDARGRCANPQGGAFSTAVAFGGSQSGRYLRDFLWQGFNRDLSGGRVFDGVVPFIPGARRTFTNFRFAEPGRFSRQHEDHGVPGFDFPFAYATLKDPVTGRRDGILRACTQTRTCPVVMHIDTSAEFWQAGASLVGTGGTDRDVAQPANVRAYMIAGGAHAPGMALPMCALPTNTLNYAPIVRSLLFAMVDWAGGRADPPPSRWPSLAGGDLVPLGHLKAPEFAGLAWPRELNRPELADGNAPWPVVVPAVDGDGNDRSGIRMPQVAAPDGTYLGWNLRKAGYAEGELCLLAGSFVPFSADEASRGGDPRRSLAARYGADGRPAAMAEAARKLAAERLLLAEDAARFAAP